MKHRFVQWSIGLSFLALHGIYCGSAALAADNRLELASQANFGANQGFYLQFENHADGDTVLLLGAMKLILGAADGHSWRYIFAAPAGGWQYDHTYTVDATIDIDKQSLAVDGQACGLSEGAVVASENPLESGLAPNWAQAPAEYWIVQRWLEIDSAGKTMLREAFAPIDSAEAPQLIFQPDQPHLDRSWRFDPTRPLAIHAKFVVLRRPSSLAAVAPLVDRYGQFRYGEWPSKVHRDEQLTTDAINEKRWLMKTAGLSKVDIYGGDLDAGWREKPTGYYRVAQRGGYWWLIAPTGNPCFYTGVCNAPLLTGNSTPLTGRGNLFAELPPNTGPYADCRNTNAWGETNGTSYISFDAANMIRKYGAGWQAAVQETTRERLHAWGFVGQGKWSDPLAKTPYVADLNHGGGSDLHGKPDIFDPAVCDKLRAALKSQIDLRSSDPYLVGWSLGNEYDEIVTDKTIAGIMGDASPTPAKRALLEYAVKQLYAGDLSKLTAAWGVAAQSPEAFEDIPLTPPAKDLETLRRFFAARYYDFVYTAVKSLDPNHLYLGFWIVPGWWENESDWDLIAPHCDVIGYDLYAPSFDSAGLSKMAARTHKPILCGEFSFPPSYDGARGFGRYFNWVDDETHAGESYSRWIGDAARSPYCIGGLWFEYRDEPLLGRGPGQGSDPVYGEDYAFGLVDVADQPKWVLVTAMRKANLQADSLRLAAMRSAAAH